MIQYRATLFGRPIGPWRERRRMVNQDIINAGEGSRDAHGGPIFTNPGVEIEERDAIGPERPPSWFTESRNRVFAPTVGI